MDAAPDLGAQPSPSLPERYFVDENADMTLRELILLLQARIVDRTYYLGIQTLKNPLDFWVYQELIHSVGPDVIVEIGNFHGGALLAMAHLCDARGAGRLIGVDLDQSNIGEVVRGHSRITLLEGDAPGQVENVRSLIRPGEKVLVIEDSSHTLENTLNVLHAYEDLVTVGSYFIVEDTNCHHGLPLGPSPGPYEAVEDFMRENDRFVIDRDCESFIITWQPRGYLRRVR